MIRGSYPNKVKCATFVSGDVINKRKKRKEKKLVSFNFVDWEGIWPLCVNLNSYALSCTRLHLHGELCWYEEVQQSARSNVSVTTSKLP